MINTSNNLGGLTRYDIYFMLIFISLSYLFYKDFSKTENFDATSDAIRTAINTRYGADVEAIRNLSDIASRLITQGGLVVPGNLQINGKLNLANNTTLSADGDDALHWLRLQTTDTATYKSLALHDIWSNGNINMNNGPINNVKSIHIDGAPPLYGLNGNALCIPAIAATNGLQVWRSVKDNKIADGTSTSIAADGSAEFAGGNVKIDVAGNLKHGGGIGAFMLNGYAFPIICSIKNYGMFWVNDADNIYVVMPGYKLIVYVDTYEGLYNTYDNTLGNKPEYYGYGLERANNSLKLGSGTTTNNSDLGSSCKLYYNNIEIIINNVST